MRLQIFRATALVRLFNPYSPKIIKNIRSKIWNNRQVCNRTSASRSAIIRPCNFIHNHFLSKFDQAKSLVRRFTWIEENCRARKWALLNSLEIEDDSGSNLDQFGIKLVLFDLVFAFENNLIVSYPDATVLQGKIEHVIDEGLRLGVVARSPETLSEQLFDQRPMRSRVEMRIEYQQRTRRLEQI